MMKNNIHIDIKDEFKKNIYKEVAALCISSYKFGSNSLCNDSLSISITNSETLKTLNRKYLGEDKATDVLSFPNKLNWNEGVEDVQIETISTTMTIWVIFLFHLKKLVNIQNYTKLKKTLS